MKCLFTSDWHGHNFEQFSVRLENGRNSRFQHLLDVIYEIGQFCKDNSVDYLFFLGDLFHSRTKIDIDVHSATWAAVDGLAQIVKRVYLLRGNHDSHSRVGHIHSLSSFKHIARVIDEPHYEEIDGLRVVFQPYTPDLDEFKQWAKTCPDADLFLFHQGLAEAALGPYDVRTKNALSATDLPLGRVKFCLGGDYHKSQEIFTGCDETKVLYVGNPLQKDFGERNEKKGYWLLDTTDWSLNLCETSAPKFRWFESVDSLISSVDKLSLDRDFIRVDCTKEESEQLRKQFPKVQTNVLKAKREVLLRTNVKVLQDDKALLIEAIKQKKPHLSDPEVEEIVGYGLELLLNDDAA